MGDIGMGEFLLIALVAVLILGPERLPRAVAEGMKWLRVLRDQAARARREITEAADLDPAMTEDLRRTVADLGELHPKRLAASIFNDPAPSSTSTPAPRAAPAAPMAPVAGEGSAAVSPTSAAPTAPAAYDSDAT
jgi:sec-independent protein translocase protein TatB